VAGDLRASTGDVTVSIDGLTELLRALGQAAADTRDLSSDLDDIGDLVAETAAPLIPRVTGTLANSLTVQAQPDRVDIGLGTPYGGVIEYGWPARNIRPAHALRDALTHNEDRVITAAEAAITDLLHRNHLT
jgi:hypothetical protein